MTPDQCAREMGILLRDVERALRESAARHREWAGEKDRMLATRCEDAAYRAHAILVDLGPVTPCPTCGGTGALDDPACLNHTILDGPPCAVPCPDCNPEGGAT